MPDAPKSFRCAEFSLWVKVRFVHPSPSNTHTHKTCLCNHKFVVVPAATKLPTHSQSRKGACGVLFPSSPRGFAVVGDDVNLHTCLRVFQKHGGAELCLPKPHNWEMVCSNKYTWLYYSIYKVHMSIHTAWIEYIVYLRHVPIELQNVGLFTNDCGVLLLSHVYNIQHIYTSHAFHTTLKPFSRGARHLLCLSHSPHLSALITQPVIAFCAFSHGRNVSVFAQIFVALCSLRWALENGPRKRIYKQHVLISFVHTVALFPSKCSLQLIT